ncbi:MAG: 2-hydroxyacyl-CoA dehydratase family protein [Candidatus Alcyoniella australis]|nr:2-hydroxyacyl-CoA dehydratase family protein [Candidatus Alcyoniella australis]
MQQLMEQAGMLRNDYLAAWQEDGGKVVGYACVATPTEIIEAAGLLPYRIRALGNNRTELADAHLSRFNCSFCRSCLQLGLEGSLDFLDGLIETNGCDHIRGMFENWQYAKPSEFFHYVKVPHLVNQDSLEYFSEELRLFGKALGDHFGADITDEKLWQAIENEDRLRGLQREIYTMREGSQPLFSGSESLSLCLVASSTPTEKTIELLRSAIDERKENGIKEYRARLMFGGSATDEIELLQMIEKLGGLIVSDLLCYGSRSFWDRNLDRGSDPYDTLAKLYLQNLSCPRMFDEFSYRRKLLLDAVSRSAADGVILVHNKFCDVHGIDNVQLRLALEKEGVPVLTLEKEYGAAADLGRMRTRVQAFLERIGAR